MTEKVWIATEDAFTEHALDEEMTFENGDTTHCGIAWVDLPLVEYAGGQTFEGDKAWYTDHDRDDVVICELCFP